MRKTLQALAAGALLLGTSGYALAVDIGGINIPLGPTFAVSQIYENVVSTVGDTLRGYGKVDSINSHPVASLCGSPCELTFVFDNYVVSNISAGVVKFTGGTVNLYLGFGANVDFIADPSDPGGSVQDLVEAQNGTPFLSLKGHAIDASNNTFAATGQNIGTPNPTGFGTGLLDVDTSGGGIANPYFDTNTILALFGGGPADISLGSSFSGENQLYPLECPGGAACVRGSTFLTATVAAVPEPESYALILAGLAAVGFIARRRNA